MDSVMLRQKEI